MKKRVNGLNPKNRPYFVNEDMKNGVKMTLQEFAEKYQCTYTYMGWIFHRLRTRGFNYRPYSGEIRVGIRTKRGIMVDFDKREQWASSCVKDYEHNYIAPQLTEVFRMMEVVNANQPKLIGQMEEVADKIQAIALEYRRRSRSNGDSSEVLQIKGKK